MYSLMAVHDEGPDFDRMLQEIRWREYGFDMLVRHADEAPLDVIFTARPHAVILDMDAGEEMDDALIERICKTSCECVVLSRNAEYTRIRMAMRAGAFDYCVKPVTPDGIADILTALKRRLDAASAPGPAPAQDARLAKIIAYIQSHLDQKLTLNKVADEFYMSKNYLCYYFKKHLNVTFVDYLTVERVKRAKTLLATSATLNEIAEKTGFTDMPYFIKVFKKIEGASPGAYRKRLPPKAL